LRNKNGALEGPVLIWVSLPTGSVGTILDAESPIHPSAWKGNSANFALTEFYEVRLRRHPKEVALPAEVGVQQVVETLVVGREEPL